MNSIKLSHYKIILFLFVLGLTVSAYSQTKEYRMMWVNRFEWPNSNKTTAQNKINSIMSTLKAYNFNAVLFQVRGQADTHYPSAIDPWSDTYNWKTPGWDPLAYALQKAHENGLEFHAYFNTHTMVNNNPPASTTPQHIYNTHGPSSTGSDNWLIHDASGVPVTVKSDSYLWLTPGNPAASLHTRQAVVELVTNYAVDGVHFDRIRVPSSAYSHDPVSEARFIGEGNPDGVSWADFMRRQITDDLRRIYGQVAMVRPSVKISCAPIGINQKNATTLYQGTGAQGFSQFYQDTWRWLKEGCIDFAVPQIYWKVGSSHPFEKILADWMNNRGERLIVPGSYALDTSQSGTPLKTADDLLAENAESRRQGTGGWCIYNYSNAINTTYDFMNQLKAQRFTSVALPPDMPWKTAPTKGIITGYVCDSSGKPVTDARVVLTNDPLKNFDGTQPYRHLTGADGFYAILNVPVSANHTLTISKSGQVPITKTAVSVTAGKVTQVNVNFGGAAPASTVIVESRSSSGSTGAGYVEVAGSFANTSAKSAATGLSGSGGRYTAAIGATAEFTPVVAGAGGYNVYVTLSSGSNNVSPGAGWSMIVNGTSVASGTVDLVNTNTAVVNTWYKLCGPVDLPAGSLSTLRLVNNNPASSSTGGRFVMDAVKFEAVRNATVDTWGIY